MLKKKKRVMGFSIKKYIAILLVISMSFNNTGVNVVASSVSDVVNNERYLSLKKSKDLVYKYNMDRSKRYLYKDDNENEIDMQDSMIEVLSEDEICKEEMQDNNVIEKKEEIENISNEESNINEEDNENVTDNESKNEEESLIDDESQEKKEENKMTEDSEEEEAYAEESCISYETKIEEDEYTGIKNSTESDLDFNDNGDFEKENRIVGTISNAIIDDDSDLLDLMLDEICVPTKSIIKMSNDSSIHKNSIFDEKLFGASGDETILLCDYEDFEKIYNVIIASYPEIKKVEFIRYKASEAPDTNVWIDNFIGNKTLYSKWDVVGDILKIRTGGYTVNDDGERMYPTYSMFKIKNYERLFHDWKTIQEIRFNGTGVQSDNTLLNFDGMFMGCKDLREIDLGNLCPYYEFATSSNSMFEGCDELIELDLGSSGFANVKQASRMFKNCGKLATIYVDDEMSQCFKSLEDSDEMFLGCTALVGEANYKYNLNYTNGKMACVDYGGIRPGYLTRTYNSNHKMYLKNDWFEGFSISKDEVLHIEIIKDLIGVEGYTDVFTIGLDGDKQAYYDRDTKTIKIHFSQYVDLYADGDWSNCFADFVNCTSINNLCLIDTSETTDFSGLFKNDRALNSMYINDFNTTLVTTMSEMFFDVKSIDCLDLSNWDTDSVISMQGMFNGMESLENLNISNNFGKNTEDMSYLFNRCISLRNVNFDRLNTDKVINMTHVFDECKALISLNLSNLSTKNVKDMSYMFANCVSLVDLNVRGFDVENVKDMSHMFYNMQSIQDLDINTFDTKNVVDMSYMFGECSSLSGLHFDKFNTLRVENFCGIFASCSNIEMLNTKKLDTSSAIDMSYMFNNCKRITDLDVLAFNTRNVVNMSHMFDGMEEIEKINLYKFDTSNVIDISYMFANCIKLKTIYVAYGFKIEKVVDNEKHEAMFANSMNLVGGYFNTKWDISKVNKEYARIDGENGLPGYLTFYYPTSKVRLIANGGKFLDGSTEKIYSIEAGNDTAWFEVPNRVGYIFENYYVNGKLLDKTWNYVTNDINYLMTDVIAEWIGNNYKVVYNANGGRGRMPVDIATFGESYIIKNNRYEKEGYDFKEWVYNGKVYQELSESLGLSTKRDDIVVLDANWIGKPFDVVYHGNGATSGSMPSSKGLQYGKDYRIAQNEYTKTGWTFNGWSIATNSTVVYGDMATISEIDGYRPVIDLYASWILTSSIKGKLILDGNGGMVNGTSIATIYYSRGDKLLLPVLYYKGKEFEYWTKNGVETPYPKECDFKELILVASWSSIEYKVIYHKNDGTGETVIDDNIEFGSLYTIMNNTDAKIGFKRKYYQFVGWTYEESGCKVFNGGEKVESLQGDYQGVVDLYAVWVGSKYTITLHDYYNNDDMRIDRIDDYIYGENRNIPAIVGNNATTTVKGIKSVFSVWVDSDGINRYYNAHISDVIFEIASESDIHLYPVWVPDNDKRYLTIDANGGFINEMKSITVVVTTNSIIPYPVGRTIYRKGHKLVGWLDEDKKTAFVDQKVKFSSNKTIYANWTLDDDVNYKYKVKYISLNKDETSLVMSDEDRQCNEVFNLPKNLYTRLGYEFIGWDINESSKTVIYDDQQQVSGLGDIDEVVRLYAVWQAKEYTINYKDYYAGNVLFATDSLVYDRLLKLKSNVNIPLGYTDDGFMYIREGIVPLEVRRFASGQMVSKKDFDISDATDRIDLYGLIEKKEYQIRFDANGGTYKDNEKIIIATASYKENIVDKYPATPSKIGMEFSGYVIDGKIMRPKEYSYLEDKVFLATWSDALYSIIFNKNTPVSPGPYSNVVVGEISSRMERVNIPVKLNGDSYKLEGYTFIGWATRSYTVLEAEYLRDSHSNLVISSISEIVFSQSDGGYNGGKVNLYALWGRNRIKVTLLQNENYAKVKDPYATISYLYYDQKFSDSPVFKDDKVRSGYKPFTGKFTTVKISEAIDRKNFNGSYYTFDSINRSIGDIVLYPLWQNEEYIVNMDIGEGSLPVGYSTTSFVAYYDAPYFSKGKAGEPKLANGHFVTPIATLNDTNIFNYWSEEVGGISLIDETKLYDDIDVKTIYANYRERNTYRYVYSSGDSKDGEYSEMVREGIPYDLAECHWTKSGYDFDGWVDQFNEQYGKVGRIEYPNRPLNLTARWKKLYTGGSTGPGGGGGKGGGKGGGGGGGGGGKLPGTIAIQQIDNVLHTIIYRNEYEWIYDDEKRIGIRMKKDTKLAKLLMSKQEYNNRYIVEPDSDYIKIKNGFYRLEFLDGIFYFGFDNACKMMTGFVITTDNTTNQNADYEKGELVDSGVKDSAKYYLMEDMEKYRGVVWALPVTKDGIDYVFDDQGRVISETLSKSDDYVICDGAWEYNSDNDVWRYYILGEGGDEIYLDSGMYSIEYLGAIHKYLFDENGIMLRGLLEYEGCHYYFQEEGDLIGAAFIGEMVYKDVKLIFDDEGKLMTAEKSSK